MIAQIDNVAEAAQKLPIGERIRLVEILLQSLNQRNHEIDQVWFDKCERRLDAYERGEMAALEAADVLAKHLKT